MSFFDKSLVMKIILFLSMIIALVLVTFGCRPQYGIANGGGDPIYFSKPIYKDSAVNAIYAGGKFCHSMDSAYLHKNETNYFGELYIYRSHAWRYLNLAYGLFGYTGSYKVAKVQKYVGNKSYQGGGISSEVNIRVSNENFEFRVFGIRGTLLFENGQFYSFREKASEEGLIDNFNPGYYAWNLSFSSEAIYKLKRSSIGLYGSIGITRNLGSEDGFPTYTFCGNYTYGKFTLYSQITGSTLFPVFGPSYSFGSTYSFGLTYRF